MGVTKFGLLLRELRFKNGMRLFDMAKRLDISSSYLSAVELGKKKITNELVENLKLLFNEDKETQDRIDITAAKTKKEVSFNLENANDLDQSLILSFARKYKEMNDEEKENQIKEWSIGHNI